MGVFNLGLPSDRFANKNKFRDSTNTWMINFLKQ